MQLPEKVLPTELRWKVQSYLRSPTAELIQEALEPYDNYRNLIMRTFIRMTQGDAERVMYAQCFLDETLTFPAYQLQEARILLARD